MSSELTATRSESFISSLYSSIREGTVNFFACVGESAQALWYGITTSASDAIDFVSSYSCCSGRKLDTRHPTNISRKRANNANPPVDKTTTSVQQVNSPISNQEVSLETVNSSSTSPPSISDKSPPFISSQIASTTHIAPPKVAHVAPKTQAIPTPTEQKVLKEVKVLKEPKVVKEPEPEPQPLPEPPRIDFVETGSIFGDRKRTGTDHNMYLLENGKFKSPGQPKAIAGPNGRTIRVSFLKGFPVAKSNESRTSLPSVGPANHQKRSVDSTGSHSTKTIASTGSREVKLGTKTKKNVLTSKSFKSVQSHRSHGSSESPDSQEMKDNSTEGNN